MFVCLCDTHKHLSFIILSQIFKWSSSSELYIYRLWKWVWTMIHLIVPGAIVRPLLGPTPGTATSEPSQCWESSASTPLPTRRIAVCTGVTDFCSNCDLSKLNWKTLFFQAQLSQTSEAWEHARVIRCSKPCQTLWSVHIPIPVLNSRLSGNPREYSDILPTQASYKPSRGAEG